MFNKYTVILIFCNVMSSNSWRPYEINITNLTILTADTYVQSNSTLYEDRSVDVYLHLKEPLQNMYVHSELYFNWHNSEYELETMTIMNRTIDACKFYRSPRYEPILQVLYKIALKYGNFPTKCPIVKDYYYVKNFLLNTENFPPFLPERNGVFQLTFYQKDNEPIRKLGTIKVHFIIRKTYKKT